MSIEFPEPGLGKDIQDFIKEKQRAGAIKFVLYGSRAQSADHSGNDVDTLAVYPEPGARILAHQRIRGERSHVLIHHRDITSGLLPEIEAGQTTIVLA